MSIITQDFPLQNADITLYKKLFSGEKNQLIFKDLLINIAWKQEPIRIFGKSILQPRLTAYYGDKGKAYKYSGLMMNPLPWTTNLSNIKATIEPIAKVNFNSVLLNLYRDGNDYQGWHSDNEKELGINPVIGSVSFGETRKFILRRQDNHKIKLELMLSAGDFLIMQGETQEFWQHSIPKVSSAKANNIRTRINLTFRIIV
jgi:alkylated DNA repair dioxygenase AlkB